MCVGKYVNTDVQTLSFKQACMCMAYIAKVALLCDTILCVYIRPSWSKRPTCQLLSLRCSNSRINRFPPPTPSCFFYLVLSNCFVEHFKVM